jgi:hypothetical protein
MASKIQIRRDTASNWTSVNPTLSNGELGLETDTKKLKAGDGSTAWTSLAYYTLATAGYAAYADTTANFTGTLQEGGSNVVTASDLGTNVATFLATPSSANLAGAVTNETGSGALVFATSPTLVTPVLGTPASGTLTNVTGLPAAGVVGTAAILGANTFTGTQNFADNTAQRLNLLDYAEVTNAIGSTGGGTQDIDLTLGNSVTATVDTSANTFTFSNPTATDELCGFTLLLTNGGSQTVTWPASVDWPAATAPTLTAAGVDKLVFETVDGGTTWTGNLAGAAYA